MQPVSPNTRAHQLGGISGVSNHILRVIHIWYDDHTSFFTVHHRYSIALAVDIYTKGQTVNSKCLLYHTHEF